MAKDTFKVNGTTLTFEFDCEETANFFKMWLCEGGEQDLWIWEEMHRDVFSSFDYHKNNVVKVTTKAPEDP